MVRTSAARAAMNFEKMPGPRGVPFASTALSFLYAGSSSRLHKHMDNRHRQFGPIFKDSVGPVSAVFVSDPDLMRTVFTKLEGKYPIHILPEPWMIYNEMYKCKRGLLFMDGEEWLQTRRIMNKILLKPDTESWIESPISLVANDLVSRWKKQSSPSGFTPNLENELYRVSLNVMLSIMLGSSYASSAKEFDALLTSFSEKVHQIFLYTSKMYVFPAKVYSTLRLPAWRGFVQAINDTLFYGQKMVDQIYNLKDIGDGLMSKMIAEQMGKEDITRIIIDFIIAAGDTTAFTSQWALYLLSKNPNQFREFQSSLANSEVEQPQIKGILKETMRLYPAAAFLTRIITSDCELGGYQIPAGTPVVLSIYTSGRSHINFPHPLKFSPKRWEKLEGNKFHGVTYPHATMPFAMGARSCIGRKIAMVQMKETITQISKNFNLKLLNEKPVEEEMQMVLKPKDPIRLLVTQRDQTVDNIS